MVSIVVNNYNYARFLRDAIDSALAQTHADVEVIVVDDGSTDNSADIIRSYGERIHAVFKPNGGQASAFNTGFACAHGDVVIMLDADDMLLPHAAGRAADYFRAFPDTAKLMYRMAVIDAQGQPNGKCKPYVHSPPPTGDLSSQVMNFPGDAMWLPTSGNAFSAHALRQVLPMPEGPFHTCADYYLCHLVLLFGKAAFISDTCAHYRVHGNNNFQFSDVNLERLRSSIGNWNAVRRAIFQTAGKLGLTQCPKDLKHIAGVADLGVRMVSLKLDPHNHPLREDSIWALLMLGLRKSLGHSDTHWLLKVSFAFWFLSAALASKRSTLWLAEQWLFPEKRTGVVNTALGRIQNAGAK